MALETMDRTLSTTAGTHGAEAVPSTAEGLLADRQAVWGNFTKLVFWSSVVIAGCLVVLVAAVL